MQSSKPSRVITYVIFAVAFAVACAGGVVLVRAATFSSPSEAESGIIASPATVKTDPSASGGKTVSFGSAATAGGSVKAFDTTATITDQSWFDQMYDDGFRLYVLHTTEWGTCNPWPRAATQIGMALASGLKVAAYTRDPTCWQNGINAAGQYKAQLQFFALDVETDPGIAVTSGMISSVQALGVRPIVYSGSGMWPGVMGGNNTSFSSVPLWDTATGSAFNLSTWAPDILSPTPIQYGGWNTPGTMRVIVQQAFEVSAHGVLIDPNSINAAFLR
jgi:hypothetical protein